MIIAIASHRKGATRYKFDNGNEVSIVFGAGTYTELNDTDWETRTDSSLIESKDVEIMVDGKAFEKWFDRKYDGNPAGYIPVSEIPKILKRADSKVYNQSKSKE